MELINQWVKTAHQAAMRRWPVVEVPLPPQRKVGKNPQNNSSLYWPGKDSREGLEYVLERGPRGQHSYWIGNATVAKYASRQEIEAAISECQQIVASIDRLIALAQKDKKYQSLMDIVNALVLTGRVHPESIDDLGEFKPLVAVCYAMQQITSLDWHGTRVRRLVEDVMDGKFGYNTEVTVTRANRLLESVKVMVYPQLYLVFRFWTGEWNSHANCWFGIQTDNPLELQAIGMTYNDQVWHLSHVCETPDQAVYLLEELGRVKQSLGLEE